MVKIRRTKSGFSYELNKDEYLIGKTLTFCDRCVMTTTHIIVASNDSPYINKICTDCGHEFLTPYYGYYKEALHGK